MFRQCLHLIGVKAHRNQLRARFNRAVRLIVRIIFIAGFRAKPIFMLWQRIINKALFNPRFLEGDSYRAILVFL